MSKTRDALDRANRIVDAARALQADPNNLDRRRDYMQRVFNIDRAAEAWMALAEVAEGQSEGADPVAWASDEVLRLLRKHVDLGVGVRAQRSETWRHPLYARPAEGQLAAERLVKEIEYSNSLRAMVGPMYAALVEARDLLLERIHGNPARSAAHNARVRIEAAIAGQNARRNQAIAGKSDDGGTTSAEEAERGWPGEAVARLHPAKRDLVDHFSMALAEKLAEAEQKHGFKDGWLDPTWQDECRRQLHHHAAKGDPRDVAAYCAFCWHHGWPTTLPASPPERTEGQDV